MTNRSAFGGGDQAYLRDEQYVDQTKLDIRTNLHRLYSGAAEAFPDFVAGLVDWPITKDVLECGCGSGRFWENRFALKDLSLTLTDLSPGMVSAAVEHATSHGFANVSGAEHDVQHLPFPDASFDLVIANHMLYHVPDPARAVAEMARVLRAEGVLVASTNGHGHMDTITDAVAAVFGPQTNDLYDVFGIDSGERLLRTSFAEITWHAYDNDLTITKVHDATAYCCSFPPGERASAAQRVAIGAHLAEQTVDGVLTVRTRTGVFICRKPRISNF